MTSLYFFNSTLILNFADDWEGPGPDGNFGEDGGGPVNLNLVSPNNVKEWLVTLVFFLFFFVKSRNTRVSVQGVESLWGDCRFIPADWGS